MNNQTNKLYFPIFYKYEPLLSALSREDLGEIVYAIIKSAGTAPPKDPIDTKLEAIFNLMINEASLIYGKNIPKSTTYRAEPKSIEAAQKARHGNFDPIEAFEKALARSYSGDKK